MRKILLTILALLMVVCAVGLTACTTPGHKHDYATLKHNETEHWYECSCGAKDMLEAHKGGTVTCVAKAQCSVCNVEYGKLGAHNYATLKHDETEQWHECSCGAKSTVGLSFELINDNTEYRVKKYTGSSKELYIPSTYNGKFVTSIGCSAFEECYHVISITLPNSLTCIDAPSPYSTLRKMGTFGDCGFLEKVNYLGTIDEWVAIDFKSKSSNPLIKAQNLYINDELITEAVLTTATKISAAAFINCTPLTRIVISDSVTSIGSYAFYACSSLTSIEIPNSVTSIGDSAFLDCNNLQYTTEGDLKYLGNSNNPYLYLVGTTLADITSANINVNCRFIGNNAFDECTLLTSIVIPDGVTSIGYQAFHYCLSLTSVTIGNSVTSIGDWAFEECISLTSVTFGENSQLTSIGDYAFAFCGSLKTIEIPASVTSIGAYAFLFCDSLTSIEIPNSVTSIGYGAFDFCDNLQYNVVGNLKYLGNSSNPCLYLATITSEEITSVNINEKCKIINYEVLSYCYLLTNITVAEDNPYYKTIDGNLYSKDGKVLIKYASGKTDKSFVIPNGVTTIAECAFSSCDSLTNVVIPDSVEYIFVEAFLECESLTSIVVPNSVKSIDFAAFDGCDSLIIYCEALEMPSGWDIDWNYENSPVVWGYKG